MRAGHRFDKDTPIPEPVSRSTSKVLALTSKINIVSTTDPTQMATRSRNPSSAGEESTTRSIRKICREPDLV